MGLVHWLPVFEINLISEPAGMRMGKIDHHYVFKILGLTKWSNGSGSYYGSRRQAELAAGVAASPGAGAPPGGTGAAMAGSAGPVYLILPR